MLKRRLQGCGLCIKVVEHLLKEQRHHNWVASMLAITPCLLQHF